MKRFIFIFSLAFFLFMAKTCNGQVIQTGNANSKSTVINDITGSGDVYTKIEVTANGEKKTLETKEQGEHKLEVISGNNNTIASTSAKVIQKPKNYQQTLMIQKKNTTSFVDNFKNLIQNFLKNLGF